MCILTTAVNSISDNLVADDIYYNIAKTGEGQLREKMSRFLAFAYKVKSAEEAKEKIKETQNAWHDARHVCWAYVIGPKGEEWQLNDNGEPSGTAGKPILGQIRSHGLTDVLVCVVRYFGGIKLGTSGLIVAYREAASLALDDAGKVECHSMSEIGVRVGYERVDKVMRLIREAEAELIECTFDNLCSLRVAVRDSRADSLRGKLSKVEGVELV